jgi:hypothetical protein
MKPEMFRSSLRSMMYAAVCLLGFVAGCSWFSGNLNPVKSVSKLWRSTDSGLMLRVGISPVSLHQVHLEPGVQEKFQRLFDEDLRSLKLPALWVDPGSPGCPDFIKSPGVNPAGDFDNVAFAREARKWGFQALVRLTLLAYDVHERSTGFLWYQRSVEEGRFLWNVSVYDSETGAKMDEVTIPTLFKADEDDLKLIRKGNYSNVTRAPEAAEKSLVAVAKAVSDILADIPWKGYVIDVSDNRLILSSGSEAGLSPGRELVVTSPATPFTGKNGQQFFLPGQIIGKIRIESVSENRSEALTLDGVQVEKGSTVKALK